MYHLPLWKGFKYEIHVFNTLIREGWSGYLWREVPPALLLELSMYRPEQLYRKIPDRGCDLLMKDVHQKWTIIQCKDTIRPVTMRDLAGFWYMTSTRHHMPALLVTSRPVTRWLQSDMGRIQWRIVPSDTISRHTI